MPGKVQLYLRFQEVTRSGDSLFDSNLDRLVALCLDSTQIANGNWIKDFGSPVWLYGCIN